MYVREREIGGERGRERGNGTIKQNTDVIEVDGRDRMRMRTLYVCTYLQSNLTSFVMATK
jgi:hypothetical protein